MKKPEHLKEDELDRIIEMAWEDRTSFDAIYRQFGLSEKEVIKILRKSMKPSSFRRWRKRVQGRSTKHDVKSKVEKFRFKSGLQKQITHNKISKR